MEDIDDMEKMKKLGMDYLIEESFFNEYSSHKDPFKKNIIRTFIT